MPTRKSLLLILILLQAAVARGNEGWDDSPLELCPSDSLAGNPPMSGGEPLSDDPFPSDEFLQVRRFQPFTGVGEPIARVRWWGRGTSACAQALQFRIRFYAKDGSTPGALLYS